MKQGTEEWKAFRRAHLGASDMPAIMGVSPWRTPYDVWEEKVLGKEFPDNPWMKRGRDLEDVARRRFEELTDQIFFPKVVIHPRLPFMSASLDGMTMDGATAVEIKVCGKKDMAYARYGELPPKYYPQLQAQMACTGLLSMSYFAWDEEEEYMVTATRKDSYIAELEEAAVKFWEFVTNRQPLPGYNEWLASKETTYLDAPGLDPNELVEAIEMRKSWEEKEKALKAKWLALEQEGVCGPIRIVKVKGRTTIDYRSIPELKEIDLTPYTKEGADSWRIDVIKS